MIANKLNAKTMEEKLKSGWTEFELCEFFNIESKDELLAAIKKAFSKRAADEYIRRLKKNHKKPIKKGGQTFILEPGTLDVVSALPSVAEVSKPVISKSSVAKTFVSEPSKAQAVTIEDLQADLKGLNEKIMSLETSRKDLISENRSHKEELSKKFQELKELRSKIESIMTLSQNIEAKISSNNDEIAKINLEKTELVDKRTSLVDQISELQKVTLLLNDDGSIEPEIDVPKSWENIYQNLFDGDFGYNDLIDQLTRAQIKQVAKVLAYVSSLEYSYEYISDNSNVEQILDALLKK